MSKSAPIRVRIAVAAVLLVPLAACATKRDLYELQLEMTEIREAQEQALQEMRERDERLQASLEERDRRLRGDLTTQFLEVERQLVQIQELTGQGQQRLADLRRQLAARGASVDDGAEVDVEVSVPPRDDGAAEDLFETSLSALRRGSLTTARAGFEDFLEAYGGHRLAPDAIFYIAESHAEAGNARRALDMYARVVEEHPRSARVPTALYRAGLIELERGNREDARTLFRQVVSGYPDSVEAPLAEDRLRER